MKRINPFFLIFEGPDGVGKTTLSHFAYDYAKEKGFRVLLYKEPTVDIEKLPWYHMGLSPQEKQILFELDRVILWRRIKRKVDELLSQSDDQILVILDRSFISSYAYYLFESKGGDWIPPSWRYWVEGFGFDPFIYEYYDLKRRAIPFFIFDTEVIGLHQTYGILFAKLYSKDPYWTPIHLDPLLSENEMDVKRVIDAISEKHYPPYWFEEDEDAKG